MSQIVRFVCVGIANTLFSYGIYAGLIYLGLRYSSANLVALILGILLSYKTQGMLVFRTSTNRRLLRFVMAWSVIYLLNIFLIARFIALGLNPYISGALALPFVTLLSYLSQKCFVFRPSPAPSSGQATR